MTFPELSPISSKLRAAIRAGLRMARFLCAGAAIVLSAGETFAQDGAGAPAIWTTPDQNAPSGDIDSVAPDVRSALKTWARLQTGLYDAVIRFDAQAAEMQKYLPAFEKFCLERRAEDVRNGLNPDKSNVAPANLPPKIRAAFNAVEREPTMCKNLDDALKAYIAQTEPALSAAVQTLARHAITADDAQKFAIARRLADESDAMAHRKRAQEILYLCIYKLKSECGKPRNYAVEKTMRQWYRIQLPVLDAWLGNVD